MEDISYHIDSNAIISDHMCYVLKSIQYNKVYIGYTINFGRRIRQHNGEIKGGAKRTKRWRPWQPICRVKGFYDSSSALRFEYRVQHLGRRGKKDPLLFYLTNIYNVVERGDGAMDWPTLHIEWCIQGYKIEHPRVINIYPDE